VNFKLFVLVVGAMTSVGLFGMESGHKPKKIKHSKTKSHISLQLSAKQFYLKMDLVVMFVLCVV
jgi:hypothetical protein